MDQQSELQGLERDIASTHQQLCDQLNNMAVTFCAKSRFDAREIKQLILALDHAQDLAQRHRVLSDLLRKVMNDEP